jgi:predicted transcriptional regulator
MATKKYANTKVNEQSFNLIKVLAESGMKKSDIAKAMGISYPTIFRVLRSDTLEDYKQFIKEKNAKDKQVREANAAATTDGIIEVNVSPETYSKTETMEIDFSEAQLQIIVDLLNQIIDKLSTIIANDNNKSRGLFR